MTIRFIRIWGVMAVVLVAGWGGLYRPAQAMLNPTLGRFMQQDPLGYVDGMNDYLAYVGNPLNCFDSLGLGVTTGAAGCPEAAAIMAEVNGVGTGGGAIATGGGTAGVVTTTGTGAGTTITVSTGVTITETTVVTVGAGGTTITVGTGTGIGVGTGVVGGTGTGIVGGTGATGSGIGVFKIVGTVLGLTSAVGTIISPCTITGQPTPVLGNGNGAGTGSGPTCPPPDDPPGSYKFPENPCKLIKWKLQVALDGWDTIHRHLESAEAEHSGPLRSVLLKARFARWAEIRDLRKDWVKNNCGNNGPDGPGGEPQPVYPVPETLEEPTIPYKRLRIAG